MPFKARGSGNHASLCRLSFSNPVTDIYILGYVFVQQFLRFR